MSQKKRVRIYKAGGQQGAYINPTAKWMMQMGGAPQQQDGSEQLLVAVQQGLLNQEDPNDIYDNLVSQGLPAKQVEQAIYAVLDTIDQQNTQRYAEESGQSLEEVEEEVQDTPGSTVNADMVNMINEDDDSYDYEDEQEFDDDLFDMAKGGIPKKADFMKQIKKLGGKIGQGQKPEDVSQTHAFNFLDRVKNINQSALLEKEAEDYYDNTLLPEAQRGREVRRAERQQRRQNRQLNRGFNRMTRNMPVGMMGQGMFPQNLGVLGMPSFYGQSFPQQGTQIPGGYPGVKMANIEVHKTGLFGRPKQYSMTFDYNTADPVKEAAEVTKSVVTSIVDEEATKEQEGKPNAKEEVKVIESEIENEIETSTATRREKTPEEKQAYKEFLQKKKSEGMTIDEMVKEGLGTKKGLEALLGSDSKESSGLPTMKTWQDYSADINAHLNQSNSQSTTDPAISLLQDEIEALESMIQVGKDKGRTDSKLYKDNEKRLKAKKEELNKLKKAEHMVPFKLEPMPQQVITGYPGAGVGMLAADIYSYFTGDEDVDRKAWDENVAGLITPGIGTFTQPINYGRAVYTPSAGARALGQGRAALPQFPGRPVPQIGNAPAVRGYLPEGNLPAGTQLRMPFQQGGMINPFTSNTLSQFVYGGSLNKYQTKGETNEYESEEDYIEQMQEANAAAGINKSYSELAAEYKNLQKQSPQQNSMQAQYQRQMQDYINQQYMQRSYNPYGYANTDYGRVPTTFNPYGRGPGIRRAGTWMQQRGLPMDAQGNPITGNIAGQPLTSFEVTKSGLFGRPKRYKATWGTPQNSATSTDRSTTNNLQDNIQDERSGFISNVFNRDNESSDKKRFNLFNRADRIQRRAERQGDDDPMLNYTSPNKPIKPDSKPNESSSSVSQYDSKQELTPDEGKGTWEGRQQFMEGLIRSQLQLPKTSNNKKESSTDLPEDFLINATGPREMAYGGVPKYQIAGTTPNLDINFQNKSIKSYLPKSQQDFNLDINMSNFGKGLDNPFSNSWQDNIGKTWRDRYPLNSSDNEISENPDGYTTEGKIKQAWEIDPGQVWDNVNYAARSITGGLDENYKKRNHFAQIYGWDPNRQTDDRFRGNYATNQVAAAENFTNQAGQTEYSQEGGQYNVGEEVEMTAQEIAKFIAGGGKLKYV